MADRDKPDICHFSDLGLENVYLKSELEEERQARLELLKENQRLRLELQESQQERSWLAKELEIQVKIGSKLYEKFVEYKKRYWTKQYFTQDNN